MSEIHQFLRFKTLKGFHLYDLPRSQEYLDRCEYELEVIQAAGFPEYFLIVWDLCRFMRENDILYNVRGSACGSVVVWALGITNRFLDPIRWRIPFERFLNPNRISNPDMDIDIMDTMRQKVFNYTIEKYGSDRVARIVTHNTMGARGVIQDVSRAMRDQLMGDYQEIAKSITKTIPMGSESLDMAVQKTPFLQEQKVKYPKLFEFGGRLEGKARNPSIHAAGVVIAPDTITKFMPLYWSKEPGSRTEEETVPTTQWDMYDCESRGLLKMDYLGLKTLTVIARTVKAIRFVAKKTGRTDGFLLSNPERDESVHETLNRIPYDDQKTWDMLAKGRLSGIFQVERPYVCEFARRMNLSKKDFWSLPILQSIIRPGMMDAGTTETYLQRASGHEDPIPPHRSLRETLKDTYGVMCFQEDVMAVSQAMAGMSGSEADTVRYGVAKKKPEVLSEMLPKFVDGAMKKGASAEECRYVWGLLEKHGRYSFNRAHAAAYGMVSYWTAYLKANFPLQFMCFLISSESGGTNQELGYNYKVAEYIAEARRLGIVISQPCVNRSSSLCKMVVGANEIIFGLSMIKDVSSRAVRWILKERSKGQFVGIKDFLIRSYEYRTAQKEDKGGKIKDVTKSYVMVGKKDIEALIRSGAFDSFGVSRGALWLACKDMMKVADRYHQQKCKKKSGVNIRITPDEYLERMELIDLAGYEEQSLATLESELREERRATGCYMSKSPFEPFRGLIDRSTTHTAAELQEGTLPLTACVVGLANKINTTIVKTGRSKGQEMAFLGFDGEAGEFEAVCFASIWNQIKSVNGVEIEPGKVYLVQINPSSSGGMQVVGLTRLSDTNYVEA